MTAITQAVAVLEGLANKTLTNTQMLSIVENYINYRDVQALTNEEKAQIFIDTMFANTRQYVKAGASMKANEDNAATVQTAIDAAIVDL